MDLYFNQESLADIQPIENTAVKRQCRICLNEVLQPHHYFCACKGHLQNIHLQCLIQWLKRATTDQDLEKGVKQCQICKEQMLLNVQKSYYCSNISDIFENTTDKEFCDLDSKLTLLLCLFLAPLITMIAIITTYMQSQPKRQQNLYLIISMGFISLSALLFLIRCAFIKEKYELKGVQQKVKPLFEPKSRKVANLII